MHWAQLLYVGLGGFLGANARYLLSAWVDARLNRWLGLPLPYGTLSVNVIGSVLLGAFLGWSVQRFDPIPDGVRLLVATGFFGAFTTFSTFANEGTALFRDERGAAALAYIGVTNGLCLLGALFGYWLLSR
jgi:CrcB protein